MKLLITILVTFFAGMGAGLGTGFAGMSAAAVIRNVGNLRTAGRAPPRFPGGILRPAGFDIFPSCNAAGDIV